MNKAGLFARGNLINQTIKINSLHVEVKKEQKYQISQWGSPLWLDFKDVRSLCSIIHSQLCKYAAQKPKVLLFANAVTYIVTFTILPTVMSA